MQQIFRGLAPKVALLHFPHTHTYTYLNLHEKQGEMDWKTQFAITKSAAPGVSKFRRENGLVQFLVPALGSVQIEP